MERKWLRRLAAVVFWLPVWQLGAMLANRSLLIGLPTPVDTALALARLGGTARFWAALGGSAARIIAGFVLAVAVGTLCAAAAERWPLFRAAAAPAVRVIRAVPVAAVTIVVFLWLPRERIPTFIAFLTVLPIVWSNVSAGIRSTDRKLVEMARVFGMSRGTILRKITLPAVRPYFAAAIGTGLGFAWKSGVAAEIICRTPHSLGDLLWAGKNAVAYDEVFALALVIVLGSVALESAAVCIGKGGRRDPV